jgi:hypothetical protein
MNNLAADLMKWIDEQKDECARKTMMLIRDDAPKNKFSIITGQLTAFDDVQTKIEQLEKDKSPE